jgi:hypothetical protein
MGIFGSNTAKKQPGKKAGKKRPRGKGRPFEGNDPATGKKDERINRNGRPRTADALKKMVLDLFEEEGTDQATGAKATILRAMLMQMALRGTPADRTELLNRGFGKVKDEIVFSLDDVRKIIDYLPPDFVDRLAKGEDLSDVLIAFITSRSSGQTKTD